MGRESADGGWWERKQIHGSGDCSSRARAPPERDAWMGGGAERAKRGRGTEEREAPDRGRREAAPWKGSRDGG